MFTLVRKQSGAWSPGTMCEPALVCSHAALKSVAALPWSLARISYWSSAAGRQPRDSNLPEGTAAILKTSVCCWKHLDPFSLSYLYTLKEYRKLSCLSHSLHIEAVLPIKTQLLCWDKEPLSTERCRIPSPSGMRYKLLAWQPVGTFLTNRNRNKSQKMSTTRQCTQEHPGKTDTFLYVLPH